MVFKGLNLARASSLAKTFTYGSAQPLVAASQSSNAFQNNPLSALNRFKAGSNHPSNGYSSSAQPGQSTKVDQHDNHSRLSEVYSAWQKHHRLEGKDKEWQQFQLAKRIEWKAPTAVQDGKAKSKDDVNADRTEPSAGERKGLHRAYSSSAVDEFKKFLAADHDEAIALAKVDEAIAEEIEKGHQEVLVEEVTAETAVATSLEASSQSPTAESDVTPESFTLTERTDVTSLLSESDAYAEQLSRLAENQHYAEIPAVFEAMLKEGIKPTVQAYHALLAAAIHVPKTKHQVVPKALDVYSDMLRRRVLPDTKTYAILIELLSRRALDVLAMKHVLEEKRLRYGGMEEEGRFMFHSNETEFDILSEDDSLALALKVFETSMVIKSERLFADKTYQLLVLACAEANRVEDMVRIVSLMETKKIAPHASLFKPMIQAFASSGDLRSAVECYDEYKVMAIANDEGKITMVRKDNDVYAALIKAYLSCGRAEGAQKFLTKIEESLQDSQQLVSLRDAVGLKAMLPEWMNNGSFDEALTNALEKLSAEARNLAMAAICIKAADRNAIEAATSAFAQLTGEMDLAEPAMAISAMYIRNGSIEAAEPFWRALEQCTPGPNFIEPAAMHAVALIGSGHAEQGLNQTRVMFARIRDGQTGSTQAKIEIIEQIDEAIEVIGHFMIKRGIILPAKASMELMWSMIDNGGLVTPVAHHLLAGMGPEDITQLGLEDLLLVMQVQAGMIINGSVLDIANGARFAHLLEMIVGSGMVADKQTSSLVEKVLAKIERPDLVHRWQAYRYPTAEPIYSPVAYPGFSHVAPVAPVLTYEDSFDPYASTTDNKGSVAITDLLEKTHGRSSSHLNEALIKFKNMRRAGRHPRFFTYAKLITAAAKEDRLNLAHDILALAKQDVPLLPQYRIVRYGWVTILDAMVAACLATGKRDLAAKYHQDLLDMGAAPSANTFGLYITTLKESTKTFDEATEAVKIFLRAKTEGVEPSSFLYNALIGKLGKARRIDDCLFYFAEMRNLGIRPTSVTYGTIVNALCRVSDEKFAEELFEEMESMPNYKPRPAPYHSLMQFFLTTKRDRSKVLSYYERMRSKRIEPTTHTYKLLIDTYATLEPVDMAAAETVLDTIRKSGGVPEAVHYSSLIHARGCVQHDMEGARQLFDTVMADTRIRPQACLYQALFEAMVANHQIADTEPILANMKSRNVEMTPYIANSLIHGWALAKDIEKARAIYDAVATEKREPSTYEAMTRAFMAVEDRTSAMTVVNEGLSRGYPAAVSNKILELVGGGRPVNGNVAEATA